MDYDEMLSAKERGIDPETWEGLSRYSRCRMVATDLAERILTSLRDYDHMKDLERQREAARNKRGKK